MEETPKPVVALIRFGPSKDEDNPRGTISISMDTGEVTVGGTHISDQEWTKLRRRVDRTLLRKGFGDTAAREVATPAGTRFIQHNLGALNKVSRGYVQCAPKWLSWFCDHIITKDRYA